VLDSTSASRLSALERVSVSGLWSTGSSISQSAPSYFRIEDFQHWASSEWTLTCGFSRIASKQSITGDPLN
jgi:hypothetical protein